MRVLPFALRGVLHHAKWWFRIDAFRPGPLLSEAQGARGEALPLRLAHVTRRTADRGLITAHLWFFGFGVLAMTLVSCGPSASGTLAPPQDPTLVTPADQPAPARASAQAPAPPGMVVVANEEDKSLTFIDAATNAVTRTAELGTPVSRFALAPDGHTAWMFSSQRDGSDVFLLDLQSDRPPVTRRLGQEPYAATFSAHGARTFVVMSKTSSVSFLDTATGNQYGQVFLGRQPDGVLIRRQPGDIVFVQSEPEGLLYVAGHGSGVIWVLDAGTGQTIAEIETGGAPIAVLADPASPLVHGIVDLLDQIVSIDTRTQQIVQRLDLPGRPSAAAIGPDGTVYVAAGESNQVWAVSTRSGSVMSSIEVGQHPAGIALTDDGSHAYVPNSGDNTLSVIDIAAGQVITGVQVGKTPVSALYIPPFEQSPPGQADAATPPPTQRPPLSGTPPPSAPDTSEKLPPGTVKETFVPGASFPSAMAFAPDGRLFYGELRTGMIRIVDNGVLLPEPVYDLTVAGEAETGLLGLAVDPNFAENHYLYVFYTEAGSAQPRDGTTNGPNHVVRLTEVDGKGTDLTPIFPDIPSGPFHDGGSLRFGPDGLLYVTTGETGNIALAQDLSTPAGKVLRINPDGSVPEDNPFAGQPDKAGAIWAYGFRNPFDLDFHPLSGVPVVGENGPGDNDELNAVQRAGNYGWPPAGFQDKPEIIDPMSVINPPVAPVGVGFYRSDSIPEWQNDLFYCTFHRGELRRVRLAPPTTDRIVFEEIVASGCTLRVATGTDGGLYFSDVNAIYRIRNADAPALPVVAAAESDTSVPAPASPPGTRAEDRDMNVSMTEWGLQLSRNTIPAGKVRFVVENLGATVHAVRIRGNGIDVSTGDMAPRESRQFEVDLKPGTYALDCPVGNHAELGMVTDLTVLEP